MDEIAFGRGARALRIRKRLTQEQLGGRAGVSRGVVARIEQGHAAAVPVATLDRVAKALDARVICRLIWNGEALDRLLDGRHAATVERVVQMLRIAGWDVATEVSFNEYGERGSIDVLGFHPSTRSLLVVEVKTVIADAQELLSTLDRKVRLVPTIAGRRGWAGRPVGVVLVVVESRANRQRVEALSGTFGAAFPDRNWTIRRWISAPDGAEPLRGLWFLRIGRQAVVTQRVRPRRSATHGPRSTI